MNTRKDKPDQQREQQGQARQGSKQRGSKQQEQDAGRRGQGSPSSTPPSNRPDDDMSGRTARPGAVDELDMERDYGNQQGASEQSGGSRRGPDQDERFGPGSSPQGRENDASGNAPGRED
jgi:hypothetical protein